MRIHYYMALLLLTVGVTHFCPAQPFVHPGIDQRSEDLAYMKKMVLAGQQPWKDAFDRLKSATDTIFPIHAHTHVLRGPYGKPNIGGDDLSRCASMAYNYALVWYITRDNSYAAKAIRILNTWSPALWDLDYNDAKLLAAWTGHLLCNAAEILRYTDAGWEQKDIAAFTHLMKAVYYPLLRPYYPQANGNWDGAIIHSLIAIAVFTDNRPLFKNAVDHFKHAPVNGSIFKYIYPTGQCQESPRDQGHVQLGIGEFAGAAQVAYTQGTDLFAMAGNRIALGFEYTARYLLGETPQCYCTISDRAKNMRDDYEYVYRHYTAKGLELPYTKRAADSVRSGASRSTLTAVRARTGKPMPSTGTPTPYRPGIVAGAGGTNQHTAIEQGAIVVYPGQSIQAALDSGRVIILKAGIHMLPHTLKIPSNITLRGEGLSTIVFLDPASGEREAMINATPDLHDVVIGNLVIECANRTDPGTDPNAYRSFKGGYNRGGILFRAENEGQMKDIHLTNLTIRNGTYSGISISGGKTISVTACDLSENGAAVPPGPKLTHNLLLAHCSDVRVADCRLATSPSGSGISLDHCSHVDVSSCEIARNGYFGALVAESSNIVFHGNLIEANDRSGILAEFLDKGCKDLTIRDNQIQYNNGYGIETYAIAPEILSNRLEGNGGHAAQQLISPAHLILTDTSL